MHKFALLITLFASLFAAAPAAAQQQSNPQRLQGYVEKLVSFGTRHTLSSAEDPKRGIGAARRWAAAEFESISKSCNNCLTIENLERRMSGPRAPDGVNIVNVLAIKAGKMGFDHVIIISGHIDSRVTDIMNFTGDAPGANDNASGSALVIEAARIIAQHPQTEATIIFALLSGEEQGLMGGRLLAETAKERGWKVSALLNNDIVGGTIGTDGRKVDNIVRVFSEGIRASETIEAQLARRGSGGEDDGPSRALARRIKDVGGASRAEIGLDVFAVQRPDRFGRGGDHLPALELGFPAVRFTVGIEDYDHQHQDLRTENGRKFGDTADEMDFNYLAKVTMLNVATVGSLADAPPAPQQATLGGAVSSDTIVRWTPVKGATGYDIHVRRNDKKDWQQVIRVDDPAATSHTLTGVIVDDHFVGVSARGAAGSGDSLITFAGLPPRP